MQVIDWKVEDNNNCKTWWKRSFAQEKEISRGKLLTEEDRPGEPRADNSMALVFV